MDQGKNISQVNYHIDPKRKRLMKKLCKDLGISIKQLHVIMLDDFFAKKNQKLVICQESN